MIKYDVICAPTVPELRAQVESKLENNWTLVGGVCVVRLSRGPEGARLHYAQAITKTTGA